MENNEKPVMENYVFHAEDYLITISSSKKNTDASIEKLEFYKD